MSNTMAPYPTHRFAGVNSERQGVGLPGHCERCAELGHVRAHKNLGCGDVGCEAAHGDAEEATASALPATQPADARWDALKAFLDSEVADLRAEMETETVLMRRNLQRQAKVLTQVREHMDEMENDRG
jgi:hypothetical protein